MTPTPLVSICMVTYNHEKYVGEAIRSALGQSFADVEVIIVNDGSTDDTAAEIGRFTDSRLVVIHQKNQGPSAAINRAIAASRGKFIALFSGDDVCHPERVRRQLDEYVRGARRVLFSQCDFIDDDGRPITSGHFADKAFEFQNRTRSEVLARLFHQGNYLNSITPFTERDILLEAPYDPGLLQLQDYDVWVRLVTKYDFHVMPEALLHYRVRANSANLSSPKRDRMLRNNNEYYLVLKRFFEGIPAEMFREAFASSLVNPDFADGPEYACEQAFAFGRSEVPLAKLVGVERMHRLINDPVTAEVLERRYAFDLRRFFDLLGRVDVMEPSNGNISTLFFDIGSGWSATDAIFLPICTTEETIDQTFNLPPDTRPRALRWDPVELLTSRVRLETIELVNPAGQVTSVDVSAIATNGQRLPDGTVSFGTGDPEFAWQVDGPVAQVRVRGRMETDDLLQSAVMQSRHVHDLRGELADVKAELADVRALLANARQELDFTFRTRSWRLTAPLRAATAAARRLRAG